ncbi:MAG: peptide chain release factor N(5)-glutamine methyltransferase, partial [Caulobacteraceae bacterium]
IAGPRRPLTAEQVRTLEEYLGRREKREPVSHILGVKGFWKIMLKVTPAVLTPRPDTESLLDVVLPRISATAPVSVLDLGVGSGAILLAILAERPAARGVGVDLSWEAVAVARENAANLGLAARVALLRGDWTAGLAHETFDVVLANPPYIASQAIADLQPEVRDHEPRLALDGGVDGLDAYRRLAPEILDVLRPGGLFVVEIDPALKARVMSLFEIAGAQAVESTADLAGRDRVVFGRKKDVGESTAEG